MRRYSSLSRYMHSLPTALFIWRFDVRPLINPLPWLIFDDDHSMLTFLAALMIVFFWNTTVVTRALMGVAVSILLAVTAVLLWLDWDDHAGMHGPYENEQPYKLPSIQNWGLKSIFWVISTRRGWKEQMFLKLKKRNKSSTSISTSATSTDGPGSDTSTDTVVN